MDTNPPITPNCIPDVPYCGEVPHASLCVCVFVHSPLFFSPTVTYRGRRDPDYVVVVGSRATGTASCLVLLCCAAFFMYYFHKVTKYERLRFIL